MFGRRSTSDQAAAATPPATSIDPATGKGRPTPKRREAEAARKQRLTVPKTRKEAARLTRQRRFEERQKMQAAMRGGGDEKYLPARDRGPVRRFIRDLVDSRSSVAEFLLPLLVLILVVSAIDARLTSIVWTFTILATTADTIYLWWRIKRELKTRFPDESHKGAVAYGIMRSTQLRRLRLPKPQIKRGEPLPERY